MKYKKELLFMPADKSSKTVAMSSSQYNEKSQKISMVYLLVDKVFKLSHKSFHKENLIKIKNHLIKNNYPIKFIDYYSKKKIRLSTL